MKYLLVVIVVLGLLFAGCSSAPSESQSQTTADAQAQPAASDSLAPSAQSNTPTAQASSPVAQELERIMERQLDLEYGVVYSFTAQGPYAGPPSTIANYVKGLEQMRFDTIMEGYETRSYMSDEEFTTCNKFDGEWACSTSRASDSTDTTTQESSPSQTTVEVKENLDQYNVEKLPDKTIINIKTSCYKITMQQDGAVEYCYSADAVPFYIKASSTDEDGQVYTTVMEATSYMKSVPASYFELPEGHVQTEGGPERDMSQAEIDAYMAQYATE